MSENKKEKRLLIAIPVLNQLEYTKAAVESIKTKHPHITLIIDNGSNDGTEDWLKTMVGQPDFACIRFPRNLGCSAAWNEAINIGLQQFSCDYIFLLNNDILLRPPTIDQMTEALSWPGFDLISAKDVSKDLVRSLDIFDYEPSITGKFTETPEFPCFGLKRQTVEKVGLFDENFYPAYFEDNDYHYRMRLEKLHAYCLWDALYFHHGSRTLNLSPKLKAYLNARYVKNRDYFVKKWGGLPGEEKFTEAFNGKGPESIELDECGFDPEKIVKEIGGQ